MIFINFNFEKKKFVFKTKFNKYCHSKNLKVRLFVTKKKKKNTETKNKRQKTFKQKLNALTLF